MSTWHAPPDALVRFATAPDALDAAAASVEQHLMTCESCRAAVAAAAPEDTQARSWAAIADVIDRPPRSVAERVLGALGVRAGMARLVAGTRALRVAWAVAIVGLATAAVALARAGASDGPFLVVAPLLPLVAVLVGFLPVGDPGGEAGTATPLHGAALTARRIVAVVAPAFAVAAIASLVVPDVTAGTPVWLLPGLALALGSLALSTYIRLTTAAGLLAAVWLAVLAVPAAAARGLAVDDAVVFGAAGQVACVCVAVGAATLTYARRSRFATLEVSW
jgi:hypothetical protein